MNFSLIDVVIVIGYLLTVALVGSFSGGKQKDTRDYFMGGQSVPWWAVTFSIVAAETSSLTFISIPGLAYVSNLNFLQLTIGFLLARILVAIFFLPAYKTGKLETAYAFLENRFGYKTRRYASTVFVFTRIAADGVRLFATAIPLALILKSAPWFADWGNTHIYLISIILIGAVSLIYTYTGGIKGVIWADVLQMGIYIGGALIALVLLLNTPGVSLQPAINAGKTALFNFDFGRSIKGFFSTPYTFFGAVIGGTFLSMASHGTDQLIVQRLLTTKNLRDSQKAIIGSGVIIILQFSLFLIIGLLLYAFYHGISISHPMAPFHKTDEIFPLYIIRQMPTGVKGLIIAGLFAAAMSTLAGSMSSLAGSTIMDLFKNKMKTLTATQQLSYSRRFTILAAIILILVAVSFISLNHSVVEVALGIASITYGGLLGTFLLGRFVKRADERSAIIGFSSGILIMLFVSLYPLITRTPAFMHWTWFVLLGTTVTMVVGWLSARPRKRL